MGISEEDILKFVADYFFHYARTVLKLRLGQKQREHMLTAIIDRPTPDKTYPYPYYRVRV